VSDVEAVKLSFSILIWVSLTLSLVVALREAWLSVRGEVAERVRQLGRELIALIERELPEGGWVAAEHRALAAMGLANATQPPGDTWILVKHEGKMVVRGHGEG